MSVVNSYCTITSPKCLEVEKVIIFMPIYDKHRQQEIVLLWSENDVMAWTIALFCSVG